MNLVSTDWLDRNLNKVKIFDASWHMPNSKRNAKKEYEEKHIKGAIFWDVDEHSDKDSAISTHDVKFRLLDKNALVIRN